MEGLTELELVVNLKTTKELDLTILRSVIKADVRSKSIAASELASAKKGEGE